MTVLFWIIAILSLPLGLALSFVSLFAQGLDLAATGIGVVGNFIGIFTLGVCIVGMVLGIISLRKGNAKRAVIFALMGVAYCALIVGCMFVDESIDSIRLEKSIEKHNNETYGEGWDAPSAIEGIPENYQEVLNKYYVIVNEKWPADKLADIGAVGMAEYYGDNAADNIGFALMDLSGDGVDEMIIGAATSEGTAIFCIYSNPENPHYYINSVEGYVYYLHYDEAEGAYATEIVGLDSGWIIEHMEEENTFDFNDYEKPFTVENRIILELTPFSQYK